MVWHLATCVTSDTSSSVDALKSLSYQAALVLYLLMLGNCERCRYRPSYVPDSHKFVWSMTWFSVNPWRDRLPGKLDEQHTWTFLHLHYLHDKPFMILAFGIRSFEVRGVPVELCACATGHMLSRSMSSVTVETSSKKMQRAHQ